MERKFYYPITAADAGLSISSYLKKQGYSSQNLIELKRMPKSVMVNNVPCYQNYLLSENDLLMIHLSENHSSENIVPVSLPLSIVYEDEDLMVLNKPAGMPIHPSINNYENSLANAVAYYFDRQSIPFVFRCINRLDRDTSGLTLVAKHMVSAGILSSMLANKQAAFSSSPFPDKNALCSDTIVREYLAIVRGTLTPTVGCIQAPIARKADSILEREVNFEAGEHAVTHYRVIEEKNGHSLISLLLETGRTHQIRVHMKYIGHPLIGDYLYNPDTALIARQALHSHSLCFTHPITRQRMEFTAPLPDDMQRILR